LQENERERRLGFRSTLGLGLYTKDTKYSQKRQSGREEASSHPTLPCLLSLYKLLLFNSPLPTPIIQAKQRPPNPNIQKTEQIKKLVRILALLK
jgi:hypothetical protein